MSGVWVFDKKGVARLIPNPTRESFEHRHPPHPGPGTATAPGARPRVLVFLPTNHVVRSFSELEHLLLQLGWSRYHPPTPTTSTTLHLVHFHRSHASPHLLSLPTNFHNFKHFHFYDIVVKNPCFFHVRDPTHSHTPL